MAESPRILSVGSSGTDVRRLHAAMLDIDIPLANDEVVAGFFGHTTRVGVLIYQRAGGLGVTGVVDVDTAESLALSETLAARRVVGRVLGPDLDAVPEVTVSAFDRDLRTESLLGKTKTDANGYFFIRYTADQLVRAEKETADVFVRVSDGNRVLKEPSVEDTIFQAGELVSITVHLEKQPRRGRSEYERISDVLEPLLVNLNPADAREDGEVRDITFLSGETGLPMHQLGHYVVSNRLTRETGVQPYFFYALLAGSALLEARSWSSLRPRFFVDLSTAVKPLLYDIVLLPPETITRAVKTAVADSVVPFALGNELKGILATLAKIENQARAYVRELVPGELVQQLQDLLVSPAPQLIEKLLADPGISDLTSLLDGLAEADSFIDAGAAKNARAKFAIADLIGNEPHLVEHVARKRGIKDAAEVYKLASMDRQDWVAALTADAAHLAIGGRAMSKAGAERQASALVRKMERAFPTAAFASQLDRDQGPATPHAKRIAALLNGSPDFDLAEGNVANLVAAKVGARVARDTKPGSVKDSLRTIQRVFKFAPRYAQTKTLLGQGIRSAADIHQLGELRFVSNAVASGEYTAAEAKAAYRRAADAHTASILLAGQLAASSAAMSVAALAAESIDLEPVTKEFPNLKSLFQQGDMCACEECRSVHGASAYVADVLQFLSNRLVVDTTAAPAISLKGAKNELFSRRPDLGDTDLSCSNTNTPLPYIDVVCELLEEAVAPDPGFAFAGAVAPGLASASLVAALQAHDLPATVKAVVYGADLAGCFVIRDTNLVCKLTPDAAGGWTVRRLRQTYGSAAEVAAAPEYVNQGAYTTLAASTSAFTLPFDLADREARGYFTTFGVDRAALMAATQVAATPSDPQIAAETLALSDAQRDLIVTPNPGGQQAIWDTATASAAATLKNVDAFVTRSLLSYADLLDLLTSNWVNPAGNMFIRHLDNTCDLAAKEIANLDDAALDRIHRFVRLRSSIKWPTEALDRAIRAQSVGKGNLDDPALVAIVDMVRLSAQLALSADALCDILTPLEVADPDGTYAQVFLNAASVGHVDPSFTPDALAANEQQENAVSGSGVKLSTAKTYLGLALGLTSVEVDVLLELVGSTAPLTVGSVSAAYGCSFLRNAIGGTLADLHTLAGLSGLAPLAGPREMLAFLAARDAVARGGLRPSDLEYILNHRADDLATRQLPDSAVADILAALTQRYAEAASENASTFAPAASAEGNTAPLVAVLSKLPGVSDAQLSQAQTLVEGLWSDPAVTEAQFVDALLSEYLDTTPIQAAVAAMVGAAPLTDALRNAVIKSMIDAVSAHLYRESRWTVLLDEIKTAFNIADDMMEVILTGARLKQPVVAPPPTLREIFLDDSTTAAAQLSKQRAVLLIDKIRTAIAHTSLSASDLAWLLDNAENLGWTELDRLPYESGLNGSGFDRWVKLQGYIDLLNLYPPVVDPAAPEKTLSLRGLFDLVLALGSTAADLMEYLGGFAGIDTAQLKSLDVHFGFSAGNLLAYKDPAVFDRLLTAGGLIRQLGLDVATAVQVSKPQLTPTDAAVMRSALKTRYTEGEWLGVLKQTYDGVRSLKRDALVAYLLAKNPGLSSIDDLYDWFLIDVAMGVCMPTSRIVQAHATLQLFVQRCLMGLEPTCLASIGHDDGWGQWKWMANFRVWEANRKIFLYPENWIEPELRGDKSELFVDLDNTLQQDQLTDAAVEDATAAYLESLDDIAHLDVMATYYQANTKTMHVFARTKGGSPSVYYHREFKKERYWTPWARVPLDIESDHLLAFDRNDRLTLAWAIFTEKPDSHAAPPAIPDPFAIPKGGQSNDPPRKKWEIQLAVSERSGDKWRPKKVSRGYLSTEFSTSLPEAKKFNLLSWQLGAGQAITCFGPGGFSGSFALTGCKGYPEPQPGGGFAYGVSPQFKDSELQAGRFTELGLDSDDELAIRTLLSTTFATITGKTPGTFDVTYPLQMSLIDWVIVFAQLQGLSQGSNKALAHDRGLVLPLGTLMPYFYGDYDRTYVIVPGFYEQRPRDGKPGADVVLGNRKTFSDALQFLEDAVALLLKYLKKYQEDPKHDLPALIAELQKDPEFVRLREEFKTYQELRYGLRYANFYHPLVCRMRSALNTSGVPGLMQRELQLTDTGFDFTTVYDPSAQVLEPYPREDVDFTLEGAYSAYNWELFFHLPFDIAKRLNRDQRFEEARLWYHHVFNPVGTNDSPAPQRYWVTKPFFTTKTSDYLAQRIDAVMGRIAADPSGATISDLKFAVEQWRDNPFKPDVVAQSRPVAYQIALVTSYIRNLTDWGDNLFRQFNRESVTQATQMYVLADKLLGPKPRIIPPIVEPPVMTYNQLEADLDLFGNALIDLENLIPDLSLLPHGGAELPTPPASLGCLYFCIPPNDQLLKMWDLVSDQLTKIRNCQNIDGVEATLALFSPPIDPGALVRAAASGLDISTFLAGLGAPLPPYRFQVMSAKATELTQHVAALGSELLTVLEKRDAEAMARLRADQEISVLDAVRAVKLTTIDEASGALEGLRKSRLITEVKKNYYSSQEYMNPWETAAVVLNGVSLVGEAAVALGYILAGGLKLIPNFMAGGAGFGGSPTVTVTLGGQTIGAAAESGAQVISSLTRVADKAAGMAGTQGSYQRRKQEWDFQVALADKELDQVDQQIKTAGLHVDMLSKDLTSHDLQVKNAEKTRDLMHSKYTNQELYEWMSGQIASVYYSAYKLAFDTAKKAERCFDHELGTDKSYIKFGYWDSQKKGLMSAQALLHDIKRLEVAYLDLNSREDELTKHVSLAQLDPQAMLTLKNAGHAIIEVPEALFDLDHPGHYMRRIKTVSLSIPCVAGPYTTVACTLSQIGNKYRKNTDKKPGAATDKDKYLEQTDSDPRFLYNVGTIQSIATSSGVSDSGLFELNFHDERYLPFEGTGAVSRWRIEIPQDFPQFDHSTISDVVLHLKYTARDGGTEFKKLVQDVTAALTNEMVLSGGQGLFAGVSLRNQFPDAWWQLTESGQTTFTVDERILPYAVQDHSPTIDAVGWYAKVKNNPAAYAITVDGVAVNLTKKPLLGNLCTGVGGPITLGTAVTLIGDGAKLEDLVLLAHYTIT
jgi:Tc toxin complex TcA C-terminal TcB-binding domain/Neuraminidase-like domain